MKKMNELATKIYQSIGEINENMSIKDFARSVSEIVIDSYGEHNFDTFKEEITNHLNTER